MKLSRCLWLNDIQKSNISYTLNIMQEKSSFMGVSDLPMLHHSELNSMLTRSLQLTNCKSNQRKVSLIPVDPSSFSLNERQMNKNNDINYNGRRATLVNGASQNATQLNVTELTPILPTDAYNDILLFKSNMINSKFDSRSVNESFQVIIFF